MPVTLDLSTCLSYCEDAVQQRYCKDSAAVYNCARTLFTLQHYTILHYLALAVEGEEDVQYSSSACILCTKDKSSPLFSFLNACPLHCTALHADKWTQIPFLSLNLSLSLSSLLRFVFSFKHVSTDSSSLLPLCHHATPFAPPAKE